MPRETLIKVRQGTTAEWAAADAASGADPERLLADGEQGRDTDTGVIKFGNGVDTWAELPVALSGTYVGTSGTQAAASDFVLAHAQGGTLVAPANVAPLKFQPRDPAKGAFMFRLYGGPFNSTWDSIMALGYNSDASKAGEPSLELCIEQDYEPAPGTHFMEMYFQYAPADRSVFLRPFFTQINRATNSVATVICATSLINFQHVATSANWATISPTGCTFAIAGQTLQFLTHGSVNFNSTSGVAIFNTNATPTTLYHRAAVHQFQKLNAGPLLTLSETGSPTVIINAAAVNNQILVMRQAAGTQFFPMQEWQTSAAALLSAIDKAGRFLTAVATAPVLADLANGQMTLTTNATGDLVITSRVAGVLKTATVATA